MWLQGPLICCLTGVELLLTAQRCSGAPAPSVPSAWRVHHASFNYYGISALYTCDGIESKVREILEYLGARSDLQLMVTNCVGTDRPSHTATITVDFEALAPVNRSAAAVAGRWDSFVISYRHPVFMGQDECELIEQMKPLISRNFSLRDLRFQTACFPGEIPLGSYNVTGQTLRPAK